jgi:hypothetical protein
MNDALAVFVIFALLALFELERIRKDTTSMRVMMEMEQSTWRAVCREINSIRHIVEKEATDGRERRLRT